MSDQLGPPEDERATTADGLREVSAQAPRVSAWQRRVLGRLHITSVFWYRLNMWGANHLPDWLLPSAMALTSGFFTVMLPGRRRAVANNREWIEGRRHGLLRRWWNAFTTFHNLAWCMTETYQGLAGRDAVAVETEAIEHWRGLAAEPSGFVLMTAHVGHWEVGSRLEGEGEGRRVNVVREPEVDQAIQEWLEEALERSGGDQVTFHFAQPDDFALGARLLQALRRGELVALQGDRPTASGRRATVEIFGRQLELPLGPVALARAAGVPLLPVFVWRRGRGRSQVVFRPPVTVARTRDRESDLAAALQAVTNHVEWAIRQEPAQWFCFRDLWGRPPRHPSAAPSADPVLRDPLIAGRVEHERTGPETSGMGLDAERQT